VAIFRSRRQRQLDASEDRGTGTERILGEGAVSGDPSVGTWKGGAAVRVAMTWTIVCGAFLALMPLAAVGQGLPSVSKEETPYVPTPQNVVDKMLEIAGVRGTDFVMDLGSGDGRIVITAAAKYGARGLGVDYDGYLIKESRANAAKAGVADRVTFLQKDINEVDFSPATVLTMYLLPEFNLALRSRILAQLRPGARVVSHDWGMGDWEPDAKLEVPAPDKIVGVNKSSTVYFWIVPAHLEGRWRSQVVLDGRVASLDLDLKQRFQQLAGTATVDGVKLDLEHGCVRGELMSFRFMHGGRDVRFEGHLKSNRIVGKVTTPTEGTHPWRAVRARPDGG
jgi:hypothetical protein